MAVQCAAEGWNGGKTRPGASAPERASPCSLVFHRQLESHRISSCPSASTYTDTGCMSILSLSSSIHQVVLTAELVSISLHISVSISVDTYIQIQLQLQLQISIQLYSPGRADGGASIYLFTYICIYICVHVHIDLALDLDLYLYLCLFTRSR